jgi:hypothetical protein
VSQHDARYWRDRAAEVLILAADMRNGCARWQLIQIAAYYDRLAIQAERGANPGLDDARDGRLPLSGRSRELADRDRVANASLTFATPDGHGS